MSYMAIYETARHIKARTSVPKLFYVQRNVAIINIGDNFQEFFLPAPTSSLLFFLSFRRENLSPNILRNLLNSPPPPAPHTGFKVCWCSQKEAG